MTTALVRTRREHRALRLGTMRILEAGEQKLVFERADGGDRLRCTFNLSGAPAPFRASGQVLIATGQLSADRIGPYAAVIEEIE